MILQGQLGIRIKAEKGANADGLIAQVGSSVYPSPSLS